MPSRNKVIILFILIAVVSLWALLTISCQQETAKPFNLNVTNTKDIYLDTKSFELNTYTRGTIFVVADPSHIQINNLQLIAWVETDPKDLGGIEFIVNGYWKVTSIVSDYPQGHPPADMFIQTDFDTQAVFTSLLISINSLNTVGGKGNISISIEPRDKQTAYMSQIGVQIKAGSKDYTIYPDSSSISFQIPTNLNQ